MNEGLKFYDNTELSCHRGCNRKYYFRHEVGIRGVGRPSPYLAFGSAWHTAMDTVWPILINDKEQDDLKVIRAAFEVWAAKWIEEGMPSQSDIGPEEKEWLKFRNPDTAIEMLASYVADQRRFLETKVDEIVGIERPFAVPLLPDNDKLWYCGRLDKAIRMDGQIYIVDHKTTADYRISGGFSQRFVDSFSPNSQMDGYAYAGNLLWPKEFGGVLIDAALVHKEKRAFRIIPVSRSYDQLDAWLWEALEEVRRVEHNRAIAKESKGDFLAAFPKNTGACYDYGSSCVYMDLCKGMADPQAWIATNGVPDGYEVSRWSPFDVNKLEGIGFNKEKVEHG